MSVNPTYRILVIDDKAHERAAAKSQLESQGHIVALADSFLSGRDRLAGLSNERTIDDGSVIDVLLTDLFMPYGGIQTMGPRGLELIFDEFPFGFTLALLALKRRVHYVGIVSDLNHHDHPLAASIDHVAGPLSLEHSRLYIAHGCGHLAAQDGTGYVKDWARALEDVVRCRD